MRAITITLTLAAAVALSACGAFQTKPDETLTSGGKVEGATAESRMRFNAPAVIKEVDAADCVIKSVKIEASRKRDAIDIKCRTVIDEAVTTTTTVITE